MFSFAKKLVDRFEGHTTQEASLHDSYYKNATQINNRGFALRVLYVQPHSAAHSKGFEAWFDYIIKINSHELPMQYPVPNFPYSVNEDGSINYGSNISPEQASAVNYDLLSQELQNLANTKQDLQIEVWNAKGGVVRQISIPLDEYSSEEEENDDDASTIKLFTDKFKRIGLTVESQHLSTATHVWRILNTHQGSPAFRSQLVPQSDFIIGCDSAYVTDGTGKGLLTKGGESLLSNTVLNYYNYYHNQTQEEYIPITLYVYNHDYDILRPVTVNLSRNWGTGHNRGILGCDVGYGLLHRIPEVIGKFDHNSVVDDVLFESNQEIQYQTDPSLSTQGFDNDTNIINTAPPPMGSVLPPPTGSPHPPKSSSRKKKHVSALNAEDSLSDYMNEELEKSKKLDDSSKPKTSTEAVPPPPTSK